MASITTDRHQCGPYVSVSMFEPPHVSVGAPFNPNAAQLRELSAGCLRASEILEGKV